MQKQLTEKQKIKLEELEKALNLAEIEREKAFNELQEMQKNEDIILETFQTKLDKAQAAFDKASEISEKRMIRAEEKYDKVAYKFDILYEKQQEIVLPKKLW
jgi:hypothetical protein